MWNPWIGDNYCPRCLLLLGESQYHWRDKRNGALIRADADLPTELANCMIEAPCRPVSNTMKRLTQVICNAENPTTQQSRTAWNSIAYTNYVPVSVGEGAKPRPTRDAWRQASREWPQILERVKPRIVIVLGYTMWKNMSRTDLEVNDHVGGYRLKDNSLAMCWAAPHLARNKWKWTKYVSYIEKAIKERESYL
jgi:hypothetical protein